jgi:hypothetical protein
MPAFTPFNCFRRDLARGLHNFDAHTFKIALTNTAPNAANETLSAITQIADGGGYTAGGYALDNVEVDVDGANVNILVDEEAVTAVGGAIGTFRYIVVYNDTPTSPADPVIGWIDVGEARTFAEDEQFRLRFNATLGLISIS